MGNHDMIKKETPIPVCRLVMQNTQVFLDQPQIPRPHNLTLRLGVHHHPFFSPAPHSLHV
ncbi:MAG: hypothetical protein IIC02_06430 [Planctomycetes bacterium]|nr:hypothetical protein [Planctomycetota bacterium]